MTDETTESMGRCSNALFVRGKYFVTVGVATRTEIKSDRGTIRLSLHLDK